MKFAKKHISMIAIVAIAIFLLSTGTMSFKALESGEYTVQITVNSHSGRIGVSW